jgi:hypothetical protein
MQVHDSHTTVLLEGTQTVTFETRERLFSVRYHELHCTAQRPLLMADATAAHDS